MTKTLVAHPKGKKKPPAEGNGTRAVADLAASANRAQPEPPIDIAELRREREARLSRHFRTLAPSDSSDCAAFPTDATEAVHKGLLALATYRDSEHNDYLLEVHEAFGAALLAIQYAREHLIVTEPEPEEAAPTN